MDKQLAKYLARHGSVNLGKLGTFITQRYAANIESVNNVAYPPVHTLQFVKNTEGSIDTNFISFLSVNNDSSENEATQRLEYYIQSVLKDLETSGERLINGLGILRKSDNQIVFYREANFSAPVVAATKVIRQNAVHALRVGDKEVSNEDMIAYYENEQSSGNRWLYWITCILALAVIVLAIIYYT